MAPGPTPAATSGPLPRGDLAGRRHHSWPACRAGSKRPAEQATDGHDDMASGDGWTRCAAGHRHWGRFGAAGLLLVDDDRVILQHRAAWTHEGDSWGLPGGARNSDEDA